jgi:hypothetical protein
MIIKFNRSPIGLGYAYKKGAIAATLPDADCKKLIELGIAVDITPEKPKRAKPKVEKAVITDSEKTVVKKK